MFLIMQNFKRHVPNYARDYTSRAIFATFLYSISTLGAKISVAKNHIAKIPIAKISVKKGLTLRFPAKKIVAKISVAEPVYHFLIII